MRTLRALSWIAFATATVAACATPNLDDPPPPVSDAPPGKHVTGSSSPTTPLPSSSGGASSYPPAPGSSASSTDGMQGSGGSPFGDAAVDAGPQAQRWKGALTATVPVDFGGGTECQYRITLKNVTVDVTAAGNGDIVATNVTALAVEQVLTTPCNNTAIPAHTHYYSLMTATLLPSGVSHLELAGPSTNHPAASLVIEGDFRTVDPALTLKWHRTDYGPPLDWTVNAQVTVKVQ